LRRTGLSRRTLIGATGAAGLLTAAGGYQLLGEDAEAAAALPLPHKSGLGLDVYNNGWWNR
jgi:hypothetical protein